MAAYLIFGKSPDDVSNADVEFKDDRDQQAKEKPKKPARPSCGPRYGYTPSRTRYLNRDLQSAAQALVELRPGRSS